MRYVSLFSGIEAASVAWQPLGWELMALAEIEPFPCAVLAARFPDVPNLGDVSKIDWSCFGAVDVVVGGSPCQAFSVAGRRRGLLDERGQLMLEYVRAVRDLCPRWLAWENVPGVLSQDGGRAFGTLIGALEDCGYSLAWRVLDAQFFGVAQRRRRVFLVGHLGADVGPAAAVLFERGSLSGNTLTSREKRKELAGALAGGPGIGREPMSFKYHQGAKAGSIGAEFCYAPTLTADYHQPAVCYDTTQITSPENNSNPQPGDPCHPIMAGMHAPLLCVTQYGDDVAGTLVARHDSSPCADRRYNIVCLSDATANAAADEGLSGTLKRGGSEPVIAFPWCAAGKGAGCFSEDVTPTLLASNSSEPAISARHVLRRLTPVECERLQGFPDGWTAIPWRGKSASECPDSPRYKALGNSMAVPVMRWIGERIMMADSILGSCDKGEQ